MAAFEGDLEIVVAEVVPGNAMGADDRAGGDDVGGGGGRLTEDPLPRMKV